MKDDTNTFMQKLLLVFYNNNRKCDIVCKKTPVLKESVSI